jgi:phosphatidylethanolamine-binding protein
MSDHSVVTSALRQARLVPDIVPEDFEPSIFLSITYPNGLQALLGNELTVEETTDQPSITFSSINPADETIDVSAFYTLAMLDPDAPFAAEPIYRSFRHWVVR